MQHLQNCALFPVMHTFGAKIIRPRHDTISICEVSDFYDSPLIVAFFIFKRTKICPSYYKESDLSGFYENNEGGVRCSEV